VTDPGVGSGALLGRILWLVRTRKLTETSQGGNPRNGREYYSRPKEWSQGEEVLEHKELQRAIAEEHSEGRFTR